MNPKVDFYFNKEAKWQAEIVKLRELVLETGLVEELKWGCPCYTLNKTNVVLIHTFKEYCALLIMKGALLGDRNGVLIQQTENVQAGRQIRFTSLKQIIEMEAVIKAYVFEAIEVEKAGLKVELKKTEEYKVPEEFQTALDDDPDLQTAFKALTPGRQRGYIYHFSQPKTAKTREARVVKSIPLIMAGKGLED